MPPPPPALSVKNVLLCCLFLIPFLTVPVQSQTRLTNPGAADMLPCGLPTAYSNFTTAATYRTFELTADCTITASMVADDDQYMHFQDNSGEFTINGNGYTITGPPNATLFIVGVWSSGTLGAVTTPPVILNLNDVTISSVATDRTSNGPILVRTGARLNARNTIFSGNSGPFTLDIANNGQAYFDDAQFLNNRGNSATSASVIQANGAADDSQTVTNLVVINNALFEGNAGSNWVIQASRSTTRLLGCIIFRGNTNQANDGPAINFGPIAGVPGFFDDRTTNQDDRSRCPQPPKRKKKKEEARPTPTPTPRPAYGASYTALQTATGMTFEATYGLDSGVHFRQLDGAGIGIQSIIDAGYLAALDVYGYVEQGVQVCFPQVGRILFLDARTMPRAITPLESTVVSGMTCASISSPGSLVLMPN